MAAQDSPLPATSARFAATRHLVARLALAFVLLSAAFQYLFQGSCAPRSRTSPLKSPTHQPLLECLL